MLTDSDMITSSRISLRSELESKPDVFFAVIKSIDFLCKELPDINWSRLYDSAQHRDNKRMQKELSNLFSVCDLGQNFFMHTQVLGRQRFLHVISALAPMIYLHGGERSVLYISEKINDVCSWWP